MCSRGAAPISVSGKREQWAARNMADDQFTQRPGDRGFQGGTYCVNFHVGGCEPSPASTIFPVLVPVEPAVSLACKCSLCPASAANGSFLFKPP
jgi:hypothetical protein